MDSGDRSLPGMSIPKWMRSAGPDRFDYVDYCASPPGDGMFYMKQRERQGPCKTALNEAVSFVQNAGTSDSTEIATSLSKIVMDTQKSIKPPSELDLTSSIPASQCESFSSDKSIIFKTVSSTDLFVKPIIDGTKSMPASPKASRANFYSSSPECAKEYEGTTTKFFEDTALVSKRSDIGKPSFPSVVVTRPEEDGSVSVFDENAKSRILAIHSAPCSPNATPVATPMNSPQVSRKSGNPFFTGSGSSGSGNFLFRSPQQENGGNRDQNRSFYETKVDVQVNPTTKSVSKSVRYVPRPSELRELNFWSPTSM